MPTTLLIACGALAREIKAVIDANQLAGLELQCLPAELHNHPQLIAPAVAEKIAAAQGHYDKIYVLYGDCGTGGHLDRVLEQTGVERIEGPHCYSFFATAPAFDALAAAEPGTFYLTDYMVRQFESIIWRGLGLDKHPELAEIYFANYRKAVFLRQSDDTSLDSAAADAAQRLGLELTIQPTGYGELADFIMARASGVNKHEDCYQDGAENHRVLAGYSSPNPDQTGPQNRPSPTLRAFREGRRHGRNARQAHRHRRLSQ